MPDKNAVRAEALRLGIAVADKPDSQDICFVPTGSYADAVGKLRPDALTPGDIVLPLWTWHGQPVGITAQGLQAAGLIVSRVALSISLVVLLTLTTPWVELLAALRALHVPRMFVLVVGLAYRYIFLLLGSVTDMYESRRARQVGAATHDKAARAFVSSTAGALLSKSHQLSEEVHMAMVSRGFRGDAKTLKAFAIDSSDYLFLAVVVAVSVLIVLFDRHLGL